METILIVDDDAFFLESLHSMLDSRYAVISCIGGGDAPAMARKYLPDMILLDVMMDDSDGYAVCRTLKEDPITRDIPVIFISALDSTEDETYGLALGAVDYLSKPINPAIAHARIHNHLQRKRIEDKLANHGAQLEELVELRTAELREALAVAQEADRAKDEFLANISHELRTPLSAVIGFANLARPLSTDTLQAEYLGKIAQAGRTLAEVINDLLDLSKITAGRMELEPRPFSLQQLIARARSVVSYKAEEKGLTLVESLSPDLPAVLIGDTLRIEQILLNLLANAVKFTPAGRIELQVRPFSRFNDRLCLEFEVTDTGIGLTPEEIARLFRPFSQTDTSHSRNFGGTGLGLAICKRLADLMDGEISVTSTPDVGTSFRVHLWLGIGDPAQLTDAATDPTPPQLVHYRDTRVLVVDDQPFNRDIVAGLLAVAGIVPRMASNGQEALDLLAAPAESFDLVLMDIQMPILDGLSATRQIRLMPGLDNLPIVAMTAHTMTHEREKSLAAGMNDHIGKPFDEADFYRILALWIPQSKQFAADCAPTPPPSAENGLPPLAGVDTRAGLALLQNDVVRYRHWLTAFLAEAPDTLASLKHHLANHNADAASMAAHTLKGRTGLLGMKSLHTLTTQIEETIESGGDTNALMMMLERDIATTCATLRTGLANHPATG
jgi:two-component system sensor histidine kinase/response regulator